MRHLTVFAVLIGLLWFQPHSMGSKVVPPRSLTESNLLFALDLYQQASQEEGNVFFSPYSISTALGMTYAGARGETARQLAEAIHALPSREYFHSAQGTLQAYLQAMQKKGDFQLAVANSMWPHETYPFKPKYHNLIQNQYGATSTPLDYAANPDRARQTINQWVEDHTQNRIKDLLPSGSLNGLTRMVLANAIYFKGSWAQSFNKKLTRPMIFEASPSDRIEADMMFQKNKFGYYEDLDVQVLEMAYAGDQLAMSVILPRKRDGLEALERNLTPRKINRWLDAVIQQEVGVYLPKFKMTQRLKLKKILKQLGVKDAFDLAKADFSGMDGTRNLFIKDAFHKAFVEVNEEGTEAAASTAVVINLRSAARNPLFQADHPFIFLIREQSTDTILFMGRVSRVDGRN